MKYAIHPDISYCITNQRSVFLDLRTGRYFCLPTDIDRAFQQFIGGETDVAALSPLIDAGVLTEAHATASGMTSSFHPMPTDSIILTERASPTVIGFCAAIASHVLTTIEFRRRTIKQIVEDIKLTGVRDIPAPALSNSAKIAVCDFLATKRVVHSQDQCLRYSVAMIRHLRRYQSFPNLVVGVRMAPFAAHAWVQNGSVLLSDTLDAVAPYTPILVV